MIGRYRPALLAGLVVVSLIAVVGCGKKGVATVNGRAISRERFTGLLERTHGSELLAMMIREEMILQEAEKQKVMPSQADVDRRLDEARKADPASLEGVSTDEVRRTLTVQLAVRNLAFKGIDKPSEDEIKAYFEKRKADLGQPEQVMLRRGVYQTKQDADAARESLMKNVGWDVVLAKSVDHPDIRQAQGVLPTLIKTREAKPRYALLMERGPALADSLLGPGIAEKLWALPNKGITDVLPYMNLFQVVQVQEHRPAKAADYKTLHERIEEQLMLERLAQREKLPKDDDVSNALGFFQAKLIQRLRGEAKVQIDSPVLKDVMERPDLWPNVQGGGN